jgi:hypothetical protein
VATLTCCENVDAQTKLRFDLSESLGFAKVCESYLIKADANEEHGIQMASKTASELHRVVKPEGSAEPLSSSERFELSIRTSTSMSAFGSALFSASTRHLFDSRPHYGTDGAGFSERLGAAEPNK